MLKFTGFDKMENPCNFGLVASNFVSLKVLFSIMPSNRRQGCGRDNVKKTNLYWPVYKNLEKEVLELSYSIHFCDKQVGVHSVKIAELLLRCAVEIESISKALFKAEGGDINPKDDAGQNRHLKYDFDYLQLLDTKWTLAKKRIVLAATSMYFEKDENRIFLPLKNANKGEASWQKAYQAVKHSRVDELERATIRSLVQAMAALYLLNAYYRDEVYQIGTVGTNNFDSSLQSDLFSVEYELITNTHYKGNELESHPNVTYVGVLTQEGQKSAQDYATEMNRKIRERVIEEITRNPMNILEKLGANMNPDDLVQRMIVDNTINMTNIASIGIQSYLGAKCEAVLNKGQKIATI